MFTDDAVFDRVITEYRNAVVSSLAVPEFAVVGHPGVFLRHLSPSFVEGKPWGRLIEEMEDDLARAVAASGKILEVNTSGYSCARRAPCAGPFLLERFRAHGGERVSLGSDSHDASHVRRDFDQAKALLVSLGFTEVWLPWDQKSPLPLF
jgi:histidinol-phosphatase (PHP family)